MAQAVFNASGVVAAAAAVADFKGQEACEHCGAHLKVPDRKCARCLDSRARCDRCEKVILPLARFQTSCYDCMRNWKKCHIVDCDKSIAKHIVMMYPPNAPLLCIDHYTAVRAIHAESTRQFLRRAARCDPLRCMDERTLAGGVGVRCPNYFIRERPSQRYCAPCEKVGAHPCSVTGCKNPVRREIAEDLKATFRNPDIRCSYHHESARYKRPLTKQQREMMAIADLLPIPRDPFRVIGKFHPELPTPPPLSWVNDDTAKALLTLMHPTVSANATGSETTSAPVATAASSAAPEVVKVDETKAVATAFAPIPLHMHRVVAKAVVAPTPTGPDAVKKEILRRVHEHIPFVPVRPQPPEKTTVCNKYDIFGHTSDDDSDYGSDGDRVLDMM